MGLTQKLGTIPLAIQTDSSNNVGIGATPNASYKLTVSGASIFAGNDAAITSIGGYTGGVANNPIITFARSGSAVAGALGYDDTSSSIYVSTTTNHNFLIKTNNTTRLTIASTGAATFSSSVTANGLRLNGGDTTNTIYAGSASMGITAEAGYNISIGRVSDTTKALNVNTTNGNVGIGTSSPTALLTLAKDNVIGINTTDGADNGYLALAGAGGDGDNRGGHIYLSGNERGADAGTAIMAAGSVGSIQFRTGASVERMRITSGGDVGIGGSISNQRLYVKAATSNGTTNAFLIHNSNGSDLFFVRSDGAFFINSFTYNNTVSGGTRNVFIDNSFALGGISSIRASKTNIQSITNNDWIYQLEPVSFNYRKKDKEGIYTEEYFDEITYGLIAEDTAPIADFLINYNDKEDGTKEMVGIEYMRLITPMLKALQEQKKIINQLSAKVTALENTKS